MKLYFCNYCKKNLTNPRFYQNSKSFKVVNAFMLFKTSYNPTSFISLNIIINILFAFESLFCYQDLLICWTFNKFPSSIGNKCIIFSLHNYFLFASFATLHCFLEKWFIKCKVFLLTNKLNKFLRSLK